ncbi:unnamed protein product [Parajaminaea phylloscopi]
MNSATTVLESKHSAPPYHPQKRHPASPHGWYRHHQQHPPAPQVASPPRIRTLDLKAKLATALGSNGKRYWDALLQFCTAKISRDEFETEARDCLRVEDVHLHNALVLGILYNASSAVPGPSSSRGSYNALPSHSEATAGHAGESFASPVDKADGAAAASPDLFSESIHPRKRLRLLAASLPAKERLRIKTSGKPANKPTVPAASASSWAGAGADLLEKRRKEEEKKAKEAEKRRLRELYTQIGGDDWMQELAVEDATRQENRGKLPVSTLQALLRSNNVPLCSESKILPDADSLADLMTSQAVETGLSGGVAADAAALMLSGLQAHLQNIASSIILAVRSNRPTGGIRTSKERAGDSADVSLGDTTACSHDASSSSAYVESPLPGSVLTLPTSQVQSLHAFTTGRNTAEDAISRASTSTNSISSTAPSSLFANTTLPRYRSGAGGADLSTTSFASTAATSFANGGRSEDGSEAEAASLVKGQNEDVARSKQPEDSPESVRRSAGSRSLADRSLEDLDALPHRPHPQNGRRSQGGLRPKIGVSDAAFLFEMSPHVVVEPLCLSAMQKMLGADCLSGEQDESLATVQGDAWLRDPEVISRLAQEERLALAARQSALSRTSVPVNTAAADNTPRPMPRQRFIVNQQGPLSLILGGDDHNEKASLHGQAAQSPETRRDAASETSAPGTTLGKRSRPKEQDPLSDVVDPVQLLAGLCD